MDFKAPTHNTPANTLIKNYINKKSRKVTAARNEIQRRFDGMEWVHQKNILKAFILGAKTDREWAGRKMFAYWDDSFIPTVKALWEEYREIPMSWLVIRYFPLDYIRQHMDELSEDRNYFYVCQRFIDAEDFKINWLRINEPDIIKLYILSGKKYTDSEIAKVFFAMVEKICRNKYPSRSMYEYYKATKYDDYSILHYKCVSETLFDIEYQLGKTGFVHDIMTWNSRIIYDYKKSKRYAILKQLEKNGTDIETEMMLLMKRFTMQHIVTPNSSYKVPDLKRIQMQSEEEPKTREQMLKQLREMKDDNPAIEKFLKDFEVQLDCPF